MAGDWLKMEVATPDKPEVLAITARMGWDDQDLVVGKLFRVWRWFDQHTTDGNAHGVTLALLDRIAGVTGFGAAMQFAGWLIVSESGISLPNFDRHCGKTAKERAQTAKRVASHKSNAKANAQGNAVTVTNAVTDALPREEKRREEKKEKKNSAPTSSEVEAADDSPVVALIPLNSGEEFPITQNKTNELAELYPGVDVPQALRSMRGWVLAKPERRKTRRGVMAFITGWLDRAQNQGGGRRLPQPQAQHGGSRAAGRPLA